MWSALSSIVGVSSKPFPYTLGEPFADAWGGWQHCQGTAKDDPTAEVSVFKLTAAAGDAKLAAARNGVKRLRMASHSTIHGSSVCSRAVL